MFSCIYYWNGSNVFETSVFQFAGGRNVSFQATPVCMWPPFVFIVYNGSYENNVVNCSSDICYYSMCWNASEYHLAVVTRMPCFVPLPVQVTLFTNCHGCEYFIHGCCRSFALLTAVSRLKERARIDGFAL